MILAAVLLLVLLIRLLCFGKTEFRPRRGRSVAYPQSRRGGIVSDGAGWEESSGMSPDGMSWKAQYGYVQLVLRQRGARDFQIEVGGETLKHFHTAKARDFDTARLRAFECAVQFARLRSYCRDDVVEQAATIEWVPVESTA
jgi:hypothetical protein